MALHLTLNELLEAIEQLPLDQQQTLVDHLNQRLVEQRRQEILRHAAEARRLYAEGLLPSGSLEDFLVEVNTELAEQRVAYSALLQSLGEATSPQIESALNEREIVADESGLKPAVMEKARRRSARQQEIVRQAAEAHRPYAAGELPTGCADNFPSDLNRDEAG